MKHETQAQRPRPMSGIPRHPRTGFALAPVFQSPPPCSQAASSAAAASFSRVVIDAGHGGHDRGAGIGYTYEKHLAFDVARRLEKVLNEQGIKTQMTRERDEFISLTRRVAIANKARRSIFVSVHFNSAQQQPPLRLRDILLREQSRQPHARAARPVRFRIQDRLHRPRRKGGALPRALEQQAPRDSRRVRVLHQQHRARPRLSPEYRQKLAEGIAMGIIRYRNG